MSNASVIRGTISRIGYRVSNGQTRTYLTLAGSRAIHVFTVDGSPVEISHLTLSQAGDTVNFEMEDIGLARKFQNEDLLDPA